MRGGKERMKIHTIIQNYSKSEDITMKQTSDSTKLCMKRNNEKGSMTFYSIFPGITLAYISIQASSWSIPAMPQETSPNQTILLNYCMEGRCELLLCNHSYVYQKKGELSVSEHNAQNQYTYPNKRYEGLEFFLELDEIEKNASYLNAAFQIDFQAIRNRYCQDRKTYVSACSSQTKEVLMKLWGFYYDTSSHGAFSRKLYSLALFETLYSQPKTPKANTTAFYTASQVSIAKRTEQMITQNLHHHYPVHELAKLFSVSETSLKNYFRGIYGQNISVYLRELRMNTAANLLADTSLSVSVIAAQVGYQNQSKFSAVFKRHFLVSPLEYRRKSALEKMQKDNPAGKL